MLVEVSMQIVLGVKQAMTEKRKTVLRILLDMAVAAVVTFLLLHVAFRIVVVDGDSMNPTLENGNLILIQCTSNIQRGDIVVCEPDGYNKQLVKRVIGIAGDVVDINFDTGMVSLNGTLLEEPYTLEGTHTNMGTEFPLTVSKDHLFLLGDNRNNSHDSRSIDIGQADVDCVIGKMIARF